MMRSRLLARCALLLWGGSLFAATPDPAQLEQLQQRIRQLQHELKAEVSERDSLRTKLEQEERTIAALYRDLGATHRGLQRRGKRLKTLRAEAAVQKKALAQQRDQLAQLLRAKYMSGRYEPIKLLLNQRDPAAVGRMFTYYKYVARARSERLATLNSALAELARTEAEVSREQRELERLAATQTKRRSKLEAQRRQRQTLLAKLDTRIASGDQELRRVQADATHLASLLRKLQQQLADIPSQGAGFSAMRGRLPLPVSAPIQARFGQARRVAGTYWRGLLFRAKAGTPVRSIYRGRVVYADWLRGFGLLLIIDHGQGYMSLYSHNQELLKGVGAPVVGGETVALVGDSGGLAETGLYFELRHNGIPNDPLLWCSRDKGP